MRKFLICLLCLLFLGCTAIKPNTMTDEELNQVVNTDCQRAAVSAAILGAFFAGIGVIPLYLVAIHECPKNNELAKKELEIRKLDSTKKEEALKREKLEAKIITKPQALEPKREQMVRNVEEKGKSAPVASAAKSTPQEKLFDKGQTVKPSPPTSTIPPQISTVPAEEVQVSLKPEKPAKVSQVAPVASVTPGTSATRSPQEKFSAPIWNIGDLWKFQQEDKKSWEAKVIRIEDKLYIIRTSKSDSFFAYDRNTLGLKFYVDKEGKRTKPENTFMTIPIDTYIYFDFPLLLGKKWAKTVSLPAKQSIGPVPTNHLEEFECIIILPKNWTGV